jgi:Flp pilus assembly protein TadG
MTRVFQQDTGWLPLQRLLDTLRRQNAGSVLVEFALSLTILLMLSFGMIDLCRAVYTASVVQAAAQAGARAGLVNISAAVPAARAHLLALDPNRATITATLVNNAQVEVKIAYEFKFITPYLAQSIAGGSIQLAGRASSLIY